MTYQDAVIRDNPVGFWILDSPDIVDDYSSGYFDASGIRNFNNLTIGAGAVYTDVLPICTGGTNAVRINSGATSKLTITNNYKVFNTNTEASTFCIEFWLAFDNIPNNTNVLSIGNNITLNFSQNTAKLSITDSSGLKYSCFLDIDTYQSQLHITIYYLNRIAYFSINGNESSRIFMNSTSYFAGSSNDFVFGPATSTDYFIIDCIAFYTYILTKEQVLYRTQLALIDKKPELYTLANSGGYYPARIEDGSVHQTFIFNSNNSWSMGEMRNLIINNSLLTVRKISNPVMYNKLNTASNPDFTNGFKIALAGDSAQLSDFNKYFDPQSEIIACQVYVTSESGEKPILSISGFSFGTLALVKPSSSLSLKLKASGDAAVNNQVSSLTTGTWYDVLISIDADQLTLTVGSNSSTITLTNGNPSLYQSSLFLGNYYDDPSNSPYSASVPVKNFSVFSKGDARSSDLTNTGNMTLKLASSLDVSQYGEWEMLLPFDSTVSINASRLYHDGNSNKIIISGSLDRVTWVTQGTAGEQIPALPIKSVGAPYFLKIAIESIESNYVLPSISYMELKTYSTLNSYSVGKVFSIKEYDGNNVTHTYQIKPRKFNLLARDKNFGIHFEPPAQNSGQVPGMGVITVPESYQTLEFWFRVDTNAGATNNYIFDIDNPSNAELTHNASLLLSYAGNDISKVYINGYEYTSGTKTLVLGEIYHCMMVFTSAKTDLLYINAKHNYDKHAHCTFGDISIYSDAKNEAFATKKYRLKLGRNTQVISDVNYSIQSDNGVAEVSDWTVYSTSAS